MGAREIWITLLLAAASCATSAGGLCEHTGSTAERERCLIVELATAESELARYLEASRAPLGPAGRAALAEAQKGFLAYRTAQCRAVSEQSAPSQQGVTKLLCACDLTRWRTRELWAAYHAGARDGLPEPRAESATRATAR